MKKIFTLIMIVVVLSVCWSSGNKDQSDDAIQTPDLTALEDGVYTGSFKQGLVSATVEITVRNKAITAFVITKHRNGKGRPAEAITERVIDEQRLDVDAISGATASSRVILKAAEQALAVKNQQPEITSGDDAR